MYRRFAAALLLGFSSGLPLALSGAALQAWMTVAGVDVPTLGFVGLIGLPYTFKFLWAPLMDRFEPPFLGRRRGWIVVTQALLVGALLLLSTLDPASQVGMVGLVATGVAFLSASQDVVIDAWRTDAMSAQERGTGASMGVLGYRLAMVLSGGISLIWADPTQGGWSWPYIYQVLAGVMGVCGLVGIALVPPVHPPRPPETDALRELAGFLSVAATAAVGWLVADRIGVPLGKALVAAVGFIPEARQKGWADLVALALALATTLPLGAWVSRRAGYDTLHRSIAAFTAQPGARAFLVAIVLYKLSDAFAMALTTPFLLKGLGFLQSEVGVVNKVFGLWLTVLGALLGGLGLARIGLFRALVWFGAAQMLANLGFFALAVAGKGAWGVSKMPAFDAGFVWLREPADVDWGLLGAVALENLTSGMGTAAFVALLMALSKQRFSATHYALLSALASVGRVWVGPLAGVLADSFGWRPYFLIALVAGLPGLILIYRLRGPIEALERDGAG